MGQISLWNLGFMAELWGENSATDNPPCPVILNNPARTSKLIPRLHEPFSFLFLPTLPPPTLFR